MRQVSDDSLRIWLTKLQDVAYEADNLLDEIDYEILQQRVSTQNQTMDQVCSFSSCNLNRVKTINQSLAKIVNTVAHFNLRMEFATSNPKIILDKNMDSLVNDSEVVGRGYDVYIVNKLTSSSNQHGISILHIVGVAGLGKSTLAKEVYNHEQAKKHSNVLVWVNVSKNLDVKGILREILKSLNKDLIDLEDIAILKELWERMHGKKYLLVLDDVRNEDHEEWNTLRRYLLRINSSTSNNIIVTTRSNSVAQIMGTVSPYCLDELSNDECWSILVKRAFANELTLDLQAIGIEIVKNCRRVPWAARVLGGTMYLKNDKSEWLSIQDNFIWDLLDDDNNGIFHVLKLSFDHLPIPSLKQCFVYCAIFPEDYDMKKDELIQHWMAKGFLEPLIESNMEMEDVALPDTIEQLIHLRLLHVSQTKIRELPKSTTKLYHLQTLRIEDCCHLTMLPEDLSNLIKLRHIHIDDFKDPSYRKQTPKNMGQLICLQTLPYFTVDQDEGHWIKELGCLNQLRGELDIYNLEYVRDKKEARSASLAKKTKIFKLGFHWSSNFGRVKDFSDNEEEVLEGLQPHQNLKSLTVERFKGSRFPSWLLTGHDTRDDLLLFDNLIEPTLSECYNCEEAPTLGICPV
ncbi:disease resistance protein RGA2-like [Quercus lobata]|uniref:disease resistance protein RGA2-like n=1 Tax=Quercus lobata TaxID=97700 RepID=UPI001244900B|nr:disease resistance protein RGA2-like [Quercus lobata]